MAKLGPRAIVQVGKGKNGKAVYSYMLKSTAEYFGFTIQKTLPQRKTKNNRIAVQRGAVGSGSIKVPSGKTGRKGAAKYKSIPMPTDMTIPKIQEFLKRATKNKPESFVTRDGITYPVGG